MAVVSNTSPIVNLAAIDHLHLLPALFGAVTLPEAVRWTCTGNYT